MAGGASGADDRGRVQSVWSRSRTYAAGDMLFHDILVLHGSPATTTAAFAASSITNFAPRMSKRPRARMCLPIYSLNRKCCWPASSGAGLAGYITPDESRSTIARPPLTIVSPDSGRGTADLSLRASRLLAQVEPMTRTLPDFKAKSLADQRRLGVRGRKPRPGRRRKWDLAPGAYGQEVR